MTRFTPAQLNPLVMTVAIALASTIASVTLVLPASAHDGPRKDFSQLSFDAELVFEGTVTQVAYALVDGIDARYAKLPHTFITFSIATVLKGHPAEQNSITLRFLGGPAPDGRILMISNSVLFEVGQRDVLFVRGNGTHECPLVDCNKGRFRVINNQIFTDDGVEILETPDGKTAYGKRQRLPPVLFKRFGKDTLSTKSVLPVQDGEESGKMQYRAAETPLQIRGQVLTIQRFKALLSHGIATRHQPDQLKTLPPVHSVPIGSSHKAVRLLPMPPPQQLGSRAVPAQNRRTFDQIEVEAFIKNGRNPVMVLSRPPIDQLAPNPPKDQLFVHPRGVDPQSDGKTTVPQEETVSGSEDKAP